MFTDKDDHHRTSKGREYTADPREVIIVKYIKHMTTSCDDEKMQALRDRHGLAGYGAYWVIVEKVASQIRRESFSTKLTLSWKKWGYLLDLRPSLVRKTMESLSDLGLILLENGKEVATVDIPNILKYADEYTKRLGIYQDNVPTEVTTLSVIPALPTLLTNIDGEANLTKPADEVETAEKYLSLIHI